MSLNETIIGKHYGLLKTHEKVNAVSSLELSFIEAAHSKFNPFKIETSI